MRKRGVTFVTGLPVERLHVGDERVDGVERQRSLIRANAGVILASGGYEWSPDMVARFLPGPIDGSCSAPNNTGDGIRWQWPSVPGWATCRRRGGSPRPRCPARRATAASRSNAFGPARSSSIRGRRFANEAGTTTMSQGVSPTRSGDGWLRQPARVSDRRYEYVSRYGFLDYRAGEPVPDWLTTGETLEELAAALDINGDELTKTVERFNEYARQGTTLTSIAGTRSTSATSGISRRRIRRWVRWSVGRSSRWRSSRVSSGRRGASPRRLTAWS